jgi:hypothetical protein
MFLNRLLLPRYVSNSSRFFVAPAASPSLNQTFTAKMSSSSSSEPPAKRQKLEREVISSPDAPAAIGSYSQAIKANGFLFVSGCIALVPEVHTWCLQNSITDSY